MAEKTIITFTVFSREPIDGLWDLAGIVESCDEGDMIGDWTITSYETVEGDELRKELIAIGNDGDFFEDD